MQLDLTPDGYVERIPIDRRPYFSEMRHAFRDAMPEGFEEQISYGMIGYVVPHKLYPAGYHCKPELLSGLLCELLAKMSVGDWIECYEQNLKR